MYCLTHTLDKRMVLYFYKSNSKLYKKENYKTLHYIYRAVRRSENSMEEGGGTRSMYYIMCCG